MKGKSAAFFFVLFILYKDGATDADSILISTEARFIILFVDTSLTMMYVLILQNPMT